MLAGFSMASGTFCGSILDSAGLMAVGTPDLRMHSLKLKPNLFMIEILHTVHAIMAAQAVCSKLLPVGLIKYTVVLRVAVQTGLVPNC